MMPANNRWGLIQGLKGLMLLEIQTNIFMYYLLILKL